MLRVVLVFFLLFSVSLKAQISVMSAVRANNVPELELLISNGADLGQVDSQDTSPLHMAVYTNGFEVLQVLLSHGVSPNTKNRYGVTGLELAIKQRNPQTVNALLEAGANVETLTMSEESVLMLASEVGDVAIVSDLISHGAQVDWVEPNFGQTALMYAARAGHSSIVSLLLESGAAPNMSTNVGRTPAFVLPNSMPGFGFGEGIIRGGVPADRGRRDPIPGGMTPLLYAARHGYQEVAAILLKEGAEIDQAEANGIWPLLMAISNDHVETAQFLIAQNSKVNGQDWYGRSPLWEAVNVRNLYVHNATFVNSIERDPYLPLIRTLIDSGADVNVRTKETPPFRMHLLEITGSLEWVDFTGQTPFLTAALAGDIAVMNMLLESGADPHIDTFAGTSPLMAAAGVNWVVAQTWTEGPEQLLAAVELCYKLGLDVNQANSMGLTALHGAANRGSDNIIEFLISRGADLSAKDNEGRDALEWANGVFLATHPDEPKPSSIGLIAQHLAEHSGVSQ